MVCIWRQCTHQVRSDFSSHFVLLQMHNRSNFTFFFLSDIAACQVDIVDIVNSGYLLNRAFSPRWLLPQWWTFAGFSQYSSSNSWWRVWAWVVLVDVWWSFHRFVVMLVRIKMAMVAIDHDYLMMIHKQWLQWLLDIIHQTFWSQLWLIDDDWWNQACGVGSFMMQMTITRQKRM